MSKLFRLEVLALLSAFTFSFVSCSSDAEDVLDGGDIELTETEDEFGNPIDADGNSIASVWHTEGDDANAKFFTKIEGEANGIVTGLVTFTTTESKQKRLYITQTLPGESAMPFEIPGLSNKGTKADGSIDLDGETKESLEFAFELSVPSSVEDGSIIYNFWSTTGKGDFRDSEKRKLLGVATIEVVVGDGVGANDAAVRSFTNIELGAPLLDGSSSSFFSLLNGQAYKINVGPEFRFFWDFGYYYGASGVAINDNASFSSTSYYGTAFPFEVTGLADDTNDADETLNSMFFADSSLDFDSVTMSSDLEGITSSGEQNITNLEAGSIVQFVDNYGNKGLIRVNAIEGTFNGGDFITFDIKIQP